MSSPNQRIIQIKRAKDRTKSYFQIPTPLLKEAMFNLKGNAFKLYCYIDNHATDDILDLYPCDFCNVANVSVDTYRNAFNELEEKGYLIKNVDYKTKYYFMEKSEEAEPVPIYKDQIQVVDKEQDLQTLQKSLQARKEQKEKET